MVDLTVWDRIDWAESLALPDNQTLMLMIIVREATATGFAELYLASLERRTRWSVDQWTGGLAKFEEMGIVQPDRPKGRGDCAYQLVHGVAIEPVQLTLDVHGVLTAIDALHVIDDREQLLLEKMIIRHFDWTRSLIEATTAQLNDLVHRWDERKRRLIIETLTAKSLLVPVRRGYGKTTHRWRLALPESATDRRIEAPESATDRRIEAAESATDRRIEAPESATDRRIEAAESATDRRIEAALPYEEKQEKQEKQETSPPHPPVEAAGGRSTSSFFWERLMLLDRGAARKLTRLAKLERQLGASWDASQADQILDDLDELRANHMISDEYGTLIRRYEDMGSVWDFTVPSGAERRLTPAEIEAMARERREEMKHWEADRRSALEQYGETQIGDAGQLWSDALAQLQRQITRPNFETWLKHTSGLSWTEREFVVGCPNAFAAEMIEQRMYTLVAQTLESVLDCDVEVRFAVESSWTPYGDAD